jgi:hypothetical protein
VTLLAIEFPPVEFLIFAVAILLGVIGKIVEFSKKLREKSIENEQKAEKQFGEDLGEAPEPRRAEVPIRLELVRRPLPRRELPLPVAQAPVPGRPPSPPTMAPPRAQSEHPVLRMLREAHGARNAIVLAEVFGRPTALRGRR